MATHDQPTKHDERGDHASRCASPSAATARRAMRRAGSVAASAPTSNDAARVSVPMYTRVGSTPSYSSTIDTNDNATADAVRITSVRVGRLDHFQIATSTSRPEQVELLLDRQAPQMVEHRRLGERLPVAPRFGDEVPVGEIQHRPRPVVLHAGQIGTAAEDPRPQRDDRDHREHGGEQPPESASPERPRAMPSPPVSGRVADQQRRDQEPGQGEEQVDAEESALQVAAVEDQHGDDGGSPQAVERRQVLPLGGRRLATRGDVGLYVVGHPHGRHSARRRVASGTQLIRRRTRARWSQPTDVGIDGSRRPPGRRHPRRRQQPDDALAMALPGCEVLTHALVTAFVGGDAPGVAGERVVDHRRQPVVAQHDRVGVAVARGDRRCRGPHAEAAAARSGGPARRPGSSTTPPPAGSPVWRPRSSRRRVGVRRSSGGSRRTRANRPILASAARRSPSGPGAGSPHACTSRTPAAHRLLRRDALAEDDEHECLPDQSGRCRAGSGRADATVRSPLVLIVGSNPVRSSCSPSQRGACSSAQSRPGPPCLCGDMTGRRPGHPHGGRARRREHRLGEPVPRPSVRRIGREHAERSQRRADRDAVGARSDAGRSVTRRTAWSAPDQSPRSDRQSPG